MPECLIMDGGMGTVLRDRFGNTDRIIWSLKPYFTNIDSISKAHELFLRNGADIIITNNYCATPYYCEKGDIDKNLLPKIITHLGKIARDVSEVHHESLVFGGIPPYGESYSKNISGRSNLFKHYLTTFVSLYKNVDSFIFETVGGLNELYAILDFIIYVENTIKAFKCNCIKKSSREFKSELKKQVYNKVFISVCVNSTGMELLDGTNLKYVVELLLSNKIEFIFLNCSPINYIDAAVDYLKDSNINIGVYPNKHRKTLDNFTLNKLFNKEQLYSDISPEEYVKFKNKWMRAGVKIIGGCCGMDERYISAISTMKSRL